MSRTGELNFLEFLQSFRRGELLSSSDDAYTELIEAIHRTGMKGEMVIRLPFKLNDAGQTECAPVVSVKKPRRAIGVGIYYATDAGRLTRRDPNQGDMFGDDDGDMARGVRSIE